MGGLLPQICLNIGVEVVFLTDSDAINVSIPKDLAEKLKKRTKNSGFSSISSYITYILRQVISRVENEDREKNKTLSKEDEEKVREGWLKKYLLQEQQGI